jgi:hypothetical protein
MNILKLAGAYTNTRGTSLEIVVTGGTIPQAQFDLTEEIVVDADYELEYEILEIADGSVRFGIGNSTPVWSDFEDSVGTHIQTLTALATGNVMVFRAMTSVTARLRLVRLDAL